MPYLRVTVITWKLDADSPDAEPLARRTRNELRPLLRGLPGFRRFVAATTGPRTTVQVVEWESEARATAALPQIQAWLEGSGLTPQLDAIDTYAGEITDEIAGERPRAS
jgi:hypothetical protein